MEDVCGGSKAGLVEQVDQGTGGGCEAGALGPYLGVLDAQLILYLWKRISFRLDVQRWGKLAAPKGSTIVLKRTPG